MSGKCLRKLQVVAEPLKSSEFIKTYYIDQSSKENQCIDYDGSYVLKKDCVEGIVASLWYYAEEALQKKTSYKYLLTISSFTFMHDNLLITENFASTIDLANLTLEPIKCLILRTNNTNSILALGFNSTHNYYCQVMLLSLHTKYGNYLYNL